MSDFGEWLDFVYATTVSDVQGVVQGDSSKMGQTLRLKA